MKENIIEEKKYNYTAGEKFILLLSGVVLSKATMKYIINITVTYFNVSFGEWNISCLSITRHIRLMRTVLTSFRTKYLNA
jgi:hypothetical protein